MVGTHKCVLNFQVRQKENQVWSVLSWLLLIFPLVILEKDLQMFWQTSGGKNILLEEQRIC